MIPSQNIVAWGAAAPWANRRQIEQDLIISRALVDIFADDVLLAALRFRGGTALNKPHFPAPLRNSEDIDLVRTSAGPVDPPRKVPQGVNCLWLREPDATFTEPPSDSIKGTSGINFRVVRESETTDS